MITKKQLISKEALLKIKHRVIIRSRAAYEFIKLHYQRLNKRQRIILLTGISVIALLLITMCLTHSSVKTKKTKLSADPPVFATKFATKEAAASKLPNNSNIPLVPDTNNNAKLQVQLGQLKSLSNQQFKTVQDKLQTIQSNMSSLASQQDVQQLQQAVAEPNKTLLGKVDHLQNSVQTIIKQTAKKTWVKPKTVEQYFRLAAVQGFSDGMRAIIDVDDNQTVLSLHEICPVCRGWSLQSMDFANQSAVFTKTADNQRLYVKLQTN